MTLDIDDVDLANHLLKHRDEWDDQDIVGQYEMQFAEWNGSQHAFAFMGARVALSACLHALELKPGDEVLLPGYTCVVVANALRYAELTPVYVDIELDTYGVDVSNLAHKITPKTRAIILQHMYGLVSRDYVEIIEFARKHGIRVIEDCAHSTGAALSSIKVGNMGNVAVYSSERSKIFSTVMGGIATTNDPEIAARLKQYRNNAPKPYDNYTESLLINIMLDYYTYKDCQRWWRADYFDWKYKGQKFVSTPREEELGNKPDNYGMRMCGPIATLGLNQLGKIDHYNALRRKNAERWNRWCDDRGYKRPLIVDGSEPVFLRYPVMVEPERKKDTSWAPEEIGVEVGVWFLSNLHPVPARIDDCPRADEAVARCINLPCLFG
jgi:dTDP-4-amino-4,6-dideoxygalactose transaminase